MLRSESSENNIVRKTDENSIDEPITQIKRLSYSTENSSEGSNNSYDQFNEALKKEGIENFSDLQRKMYFNDSSNLSKTVEILRKKYFTDNELEQLNEVDNRIIENPTDIQSLMKAGTILKEASLRLIDSKNEEEMDTFIKDCLFASSSKFQAITQIDSQCSDAFIGWGDCLYIIAEHFKLPLFEYAIEHYKTALNIDPSRYKIMCKVGLTLCKYSSYIHNNMGLEYPVSTSSLDEESNSYFEKAVKIKSNSHRAYVYWGDALFEKLLRTYNIDEISALLNEISSKYIKAITIKPYKLNSFMKWSSCLDHVLEYYVKYYESAKVGFKTCFYQYLNVIRVLSTEKDSIYRKDLKKEIDIPLRPIIAFALVDHSPFVRENAFDTLIEISKNAISKELKKEAEKQVCFVQEIYNLKAESVKDQKKMIYRILKSMPRSALELWEKSQLKIDDVYSNYDIFMNALYFSVDKEASKHAIFSSQKKINKAYEFKIDDIENELIEEDPFLSLKDNVLLSTGGFGSVYVASNKKGERIAIKVIKVSKYSSKYKKALYEIKMMKKAASPYVIKYHSCYYFNNKLFILMEYCDAATLRTLYKEVYLTENEIAYFIREICLGIAHLHKIGIAHLDIKSENILLTVDGKVKIADFGLAKEVPYGKETLTSMVGTSHWMAPEIIQRKKYGQKVDIWCLGCVCLELAQGSSPNSTMTPLKAIFHTGKNGPPIFNPNPPEDAKWGYNMVNFINETLHPDPSRRPTAQHLLSHPFIENVHVDMKTLIKKISLSSMGTSLKVNGLI